MGKLSERIEGRNKARDEANLITALETNYVSQLETIDNYDSVDEKNRRGDVVVNRSIERRQMASRRAVESIIEQIQDCYERTGRTPQEIDDMMWEESIEDFLNPPSANTNHETPQYEWLQDMNRDLESNFIYIEFGRQLVESDNPVRTYSAYSLYTGAKALVALLTSVGGGYDLLMKVWRDGYYTDAELYQSVKAFQAEVEPTTPPNEYMAILFTQCPWSFGAIESLLVAYSNACRVAREVILRRDNVYVSDTPLPDDLEYFPDTLEDEIGSRRMERAIVEYTSLDSANVDQVAAKFGVGQKKLRQELKDRGLMRTRGRPKVR